ncbi:hypothetical protein D9753_36165 [Streptomyces dangxiongensis]|uniref:Uncharacterized protein n=1 Tax=Streptomyces dangxiongensis TaxID=1442032 RepID=A0A3G2JLQ8_9ACTN|nr:hypothetical protein [Streptomyces dangxiongensis]AYN37687.1 hypothetical protein D9753_00230 [Streptomyces dangxiongensis]AYN43380.1 hypothetical protein D9753_36165 [Streptomyces dangxiongensis]
MTSTPHSAAPDDTLQKWTPSWSPDHTDSGLPPITLITDTHDQPPYTTTALAAHQPGLGRIAVHPTPLATAPAYLAHDLIRALGKHLPPPHIDPPWWTGNADESWRIAAAWTQALNISHYVICRAHRITGRHLEHLMALRELTRIRLTLVVSGPTSAALATILNTVAHHQIDTLEDARQHLNQDTSSRPPASYPWWHSAPFPGPHDEPWYELPPRPRHPAGTPDEITTSSRGTPTRLHATDSRPPAIALPAHTHPDTPSGPHHEIVAQRIHTRIAHPIHAAAVAIRALAGYGTDQLSQLTTATPEHPRADLPTELPNWARLLLDAACIHTDLQAYIRHDLPAHLSGADRPFRLGSWDRNDIAHATETCHLIAARARRARQRS